MLLALLTSGCAWVMGVNPSPGDGSTEVEILAPANATRVPTDGSAALSLRLAAGLDGDDVTALVYPLDNAGFGTPVDVSARFTGQPGPVVGAGLGATDLTEGPNAVVVSAGETTVWVTLSWEPDIDVGLADRCEFLGQSKCLLPVPNDWFTVADPSTDTGRRISLDQDSLPANATGTHIDPTEWNRNDGWSPGSPLGVHLPGIDAEASGLAPITDMARSLDADAPIVIVDAATGERHPYWAEMDALATSDATRMLIIRPARNFAEGHRYVVGLRDLFDTGGQPIEASRAFQVFRDGILTFIPAVEERRTSMAGILGTLAGAGVGTGDLVLAWDFTIASERSLSERVLHIRDDAFASLGGAAPSFTVTSTQNNVSSTIYRRVRGTFQVPLYLTGSGAPGSSFNYTSSDPDALPVRNGTYTADFVCNIPRSTTASGNDPVTPGRGIVYGHGLLGDRNEVNSAGDLANGVNAVMCATDWIGMSTPDLANVATILTDASGFRTLADRVQQSFLNMQFLARLIKDPDGFSSHSSFRAGASSTPVFVADEVYFNGNSQGGILGGAATAVSTEWTKAVLGVPAMNFSTLLTRSVHWDVYGAVFNASYTDELDRDIVGGLIQMLWDRAEADGYAHHMTDDPYAGTPAHDVLLIEAFGDHQVANVATEVEARTIGAAVQQPALAAGRSPDVEPFWGIDPIPSFPWGGSALVMWDFGTPAPPTTNTAPHPPEYGDDPHGMPRADPRVWQQASDFLDGVLVDACGGVPCQG